MHNPFEFTDKEKACVTGKEQLAMLERLVEFVNERLSEIETLQGKVDNLENNQPTPSK
tara:strand:+ start:310 stop:483 length:174 start_codon:yes stop_codon:yes gene_type:complete